MIGKVMPPCLLIISQVYVPDSAAVGQYLADVAEEMANRGWTVRVLTASRGYSDPRISFPASETRGGVHIRRLPLSSFGKRSIAVRLLAQWIFLLQAVFYAIFMPGVSAVVVSTSPPFAGFAGAIIKILRGVPFLWWVMDLNPDQLVASGKVTHRSLLVRVFNWINSLTIQRAAIVIALDRFMAERLTRRYDIAISEKLHVIPPWPHTDAPSMIDAKEDAPLNSGAHFRKRHGLESRFVVMYSGNHAIQHSLDTLLKASAHLEDDPVLKFVFIGGGVGKVDVEQRIAAGATNVLSMPYEPLETLGDSLGAADLHVVSMGQNVVGIVHPCKIYGAMAVGRPILFFGPRESHVGELVEPNGIGWRVEHGDIPAAVAAIKEAMSLSKSARADLGRRASSVIAERFSRQNLMNEVCICIEQIKK